MNIADVDTLAGDWLTWVPFAVGWLLGWTLLARPRPLPTTESRTESVAVVVPARNEAHALPALLPSIECQLREGDELIVVDDGSSDGTADVARRLGARVIAADPLPAGWSGKPHACWAGAEAAGAEVVAFVDADVTAGPTLLDGLAVAVRDAPDALVSVQPWHTPKGPVEHLGLFGNLVALMGVGRFSIAGSRFAASTRPVAFGAVLAMRLDRYRDLGGHAAPTVRGAVIEDVALARLAGRSTVFTGRGAASFRMYPGGGRELVAGWTRVLAAGVSASPPWAVVGAALWLWAIAAASFVGGLAVALTMLQLAILSRVAGRFWPVVVVFYPLPLIAFVALTLRSVWVRVRGGRVGWKDRSVAAG